MDFEVDLWYVQYQFLKKAQESVENINSLKEVLFLTWDHGRDKEVNRISAIKELYEGICGNCQVIFGEHPLRQEIVGRLKALDQQILAGEQFHFTQLLSENELRYLVQLDGLVGANVDFPNAMDADIKELIKMVEFEGAPETNLVIKKGLIKRDSGLFSQFKDATAVLTRDK